ncbi:MAG TPA: phosphoribosyltransferase family protein [Aquabacterium sp.]|nr:phosphoribosyltransferase family protein [Aquabacterium sp.]
MSSPAESRSCLYDQPALELVMAAMASQIAAWARQHERIALVGVLRRGAPLADRLTERLVREHGLTRPLRLDLSVKRYADDLTLLYPETRLDESVEHASLDLTSYHLLVVDDVLYQGYSILKVLPYLASKHPAEIRVATLVDRCVARLPVHADVVGVRLQVAPSDIVECHVPPYEGEFQIQCVQPVTEA